MTDDASPNPQPLDVALQTPRRRTGPSPAGFGLVLQWGLREQLTLKRLAIWLVVAAGLGALVVLIVTGTGLGRRRIADPAFQLWRVLDVQTLQILVPLVALLIVGPGYSREVRQRTLVYHLVRPVSRSTVFLARYVAGVLPATLIAACLFWPTLALSGVDVPGHVYLSTTVTAAVGVAALGAVYYTLSALFKRGLIAGLIYTFAIEGMVGNFPGTMQKLSVRFHLRSVHHGLTDGAFRDLSPMVERAIDSPSTRGGGPFSMVTFSQTEADPPQVAILVLLGIAAALLAFGVYVIRRRDFALKD